MVKNYRNSVKQLSKTWANFIEPVTPHQAVRQQNLRLLASVCLFSSLLSAFMVMGSILIVSINPLVGPVLYILIPLSLLTFCAYVLIRYGYPQVAVILLSIYITLMLYITAIGANRPTPFYYLLISVILLSLAFSRTTVALITLLQIIGLFIFVSVGKQFTFVQIFLGPALFLTFMTMALMLFWRFIESQEALRREQLTRSETYLRSVMDNIPDHIYIKDLNHRFVMVNRSALRWHRFESEEEMIGKIDSELPPPLSLTDLAQFRQEEDEILATGKALINKDYVSPRASVRSGYMLVTKVPLRDNQGNIIGLVGINRDITELKNTEAQLREREQTLQHIIDNMPVLFDAFDEQNNVVFWNRECERVTGYTAAEIVGRPDALSLLYPSPDYLQTAITTSNKLNKFYRDLEWELTCKDGSKRIIAWANVSQQAPIPGWDSWCIGVDVTDRKQMESETIQFALQNERLYLIGEFVRAVSHDFRTALSNIQNSNYFIRRGLSEGDTRRVPERLDRIEENITRLVRQIDNLQAMAALQTIEPVLTDLNRILRLSIAEQENRLEKRALKVDFTLSEHIPLIGVDPDHIQQALHNLIDNAINHSPDGGLLILRSHNDARYVYIEIGDQGGGISEDKLPYIFDLFYRTDEARSLHKGGIGLGLSMVKMIAEAHSGTVKVHSVAGEGTTFTLALPIQQA